MRAMIFAGCALLSMFTAESFADSTPTQEELIARYERALSIFERMEYHVSGKTYFLGGPIHKQKTQIQKETTVCLRDGARWKVQTRDRTMNRPENGEALKEQEEREYEYVLRGTGDMAASRGGGEPGLVVWAHLNPKAEGVNPGYFNVNNAIQYGAVVGDSGRLLPDLLRMCALSVRSDSLVGNAVFILEGRGPYGLYKLWLDPSIGYLPRRIEILKEGNDLMGNKAISQITGDGSLYPASRQKQFSVVVEDFQYQPLGAGFVPTTYSEDAQWIYEDGSQVSVSTAVVLSEFTLLTDSSDKLSDKAFELSMKIPDGTRVDVLDSPNISYLWRDGKIEKGVGRDAVQVLEGLKFENSVRVRSRLMIGCVLLIIILVGVLFWRRQRQAKIARH